MSVEQQLRYQRMRAGIQRFGEAEDGELRPRSTLGGARYPRFPIGIGEIDRENAPQGGSGHGSTLFAGGSGVGKSYAAMGAALDNAYAGRVVLHVDAEMDQGLLNRRIYAWHKSSPDKTLEDFGMIEGDTYLWLPAPSEFAFSAVQNVLLRTVREHHEGVIIVVDSLNSVCDRLKPAFRGENEFEKLYRFLNSAAKMSRDSAGDVGWILISEVNKLGTVYGGERMRHRTNQVYDFTFDEDTGCTKINCTRNRDGQLKDYGLFFVDYNQARIRKHGKEMSLEEMEREAF